MMRKSRGRGNMDVCISVYMGKNFGARMKSTRISGTVKSLLFMKAILEWKPLN